MENKKKRKGWIWILILLLLVGTGVSLFFRGCQGEVEDDSIIEQPTGDSISTHIDTLPILDSVLVLDTILGDSVYVVDTLADVETIVEPKPLDDATVEQPADKDAESEQQKKLLEEKQRQEQLRREAEEQRRQQEAEDAERKRLEEEARLAEEEAERQRQQAILEEQQTTEGVLPGLFSVASDRKIVFSKGNLQYQASTDTWRFAENQWVMLGLRNENIDPDNPDWIDLFGWGTSGYSKKHPFMVSRHASDYASGERNISNTKYDWGVYNAISNGGNTENIWRVLTNNEWRYLFCKRKNASKLFTFATVANVKGIIILPDDWQTPAGQKLELSIYKGMKYVGDDEYINNVAKTSLFDHNNISANNWAILEENGAVFLPAAGGRDYSNVFEEQVCGFYWSGTHIGTLEAYMVGFSSGNFVVSDYELRSCGFSVRLVRVVKNQ